MKLVSILKALGDLTRLRIFNLVSKRDLCVCELQEILEIGQSSVSQHCNKLKVNDLLISYKRSQWVIYTINKETLKEYPFLLDLLNNLEGSSCIFQEDIGKIDSLKSCCKHLDAGQSI